MLVKPSPDPKALPEDSIGVNVKDSSHSQNLRLVRGRCFYFDPVASHALTLLSCDWIRLVVVLSPIIWM
jgi:hypothetical protein